MQLNRKHSLIFLALAATQQLAVAGDPASISAGPIEIFPTISGVIKHDDNIVLSDNNEVDSMVYEISPGVTAVLRDRMNTYHLSYNLKDASYVDSDEDDYTDHHLNANAHLELNSRNKLDLSAGLDKGHEARGQGASAGGGTAIGEPAEYDDVTYGLSYQYGSNEGGARLVFELDELNKEWTNNRVVNAARDRDETHAGATFFYKIGGSTNAFIEYDYTDINYDIDPLNGLTLDSEENEYNVGVTWEATAKTTGTAKLGRIDKKFDSAGREDFDSASWAVDINWQPQDHTLITLHTGKTVDESTGVGSLIERQQNSITLDQDWSERLRMRLTASVADDSHEGSQREDDITSYGAHAIYKFRRWLSFDLGYDFDERDSNQAGLDYEHNVVSLGFNVSL